VFLELNEKGIVTRKLETKSPEEKVRISERPLSMAIEKVAKIR
jgi:hypothetical protein